MCSEQWAVSSIQNPVTSVPLQTGIARPGRHLALQASTALHFTGPVVATVASRSFCRHRSRSCRDRRPSAPAVRREEGGGRREEAGGRREEGGGRRNL